MSERLVTREQALAFVEALTGTHGSEGPVRNSMGAWYSLTSLLGLRGVATTYELEKSYGSGGLKRQRFIQLLRDIADVLEGKSDGTD